MKFGVIIIFIFIIAVTAQANNQTDVEKNVSFIMDIKKWLRSRYITIFYDDNDKETRFMFKLSTLLFEKGIQVLTLKLSNLDLLKYSYEKRTNRPLIIVYLSTIESLIKLEQKSKKINMKWVIWMMIFKETHGKPLLNYCVNPPDGNSFHLSFNSKVLVKCYDNENIREWYSIYENKTEIRDLITWDPKNGLSLKSVKRLYDRRFSIGGKTLRAVTMKRSNDQSIINRIQFFSEVLELLGQTMNFSTKTVAEEDQYGTWENGRWSGVMSKIYLGEADLATTEMTMTENRLRFVDFSVPLLDSKKAFYFKKPNGTKIRGFGYFQAFHKGVWVVLLSFLIIIPICLTCIAIAYRVEKCYGLPFIFLENFLKVWTIYCQQGLTDFPKRSSLRIVYFVTFMSSFVILSAYSASLISHLTVSKPQLPFSNAEEFYKQDSYKVVVLRRAETFETLKNSRDWNSRRIWSFMKNEEDLPQTYTEGFRMVCQERRTSFYIDQTAEGVIRNYAPCPLTKIRTLTRTSLAISLPKESPYTEVFNYHLQKLKENGILKRIEGNHYRKRINFGTSQTGSIALQGIKSILVLVMGGFALSTFILILEKIHFNYCKRRNRKKYKIDFFIRRQKSTTVVTVNTNSNISHCANVAE